MADKQVLELVQLAEDKSAEARGRLLGNITDLFISEENRLNEHERALSTDILMKLVDTVEAEVRQNLSQTLAKSDANIPELLNHLANDQIPIARPILEKSKFLQDEELIEIVRMRTDEHRLSIALRDQVSEEVAEALVEYGDQDVIETLIRNPDAKLSQHAMEYLVAESRRVDRYQEPLLRRADLPTELAYRMYWWVSAALRKHILTEFDIDPSVLDDAVQKAAQSTIDEHKEGDGVFIRARKLVRRMANLGELNVKFLVQCLRQQRIPVFIAGLAEFGSIDVRTAWRIFSDKGGESLAVLARAVDMDLNDFTTLFLLVSEARDGAGAQQTSILNRILELFNAVKRENAQAALHYWQRDATYQMALDELENVG